MIPDAVNVQQLKSSMAAATTTVKAGDSGNTTVETTVNADKSKTYTVDIKKRLELTQCNYNYRRSTTLHFNKR